MERNFKYTPAAKPQPVYFEQIFAEKPGGGMLKGQTTDIPKTVAVAKASDSDLFIPIKGYRLVEAVKTTDTTIKIAKGSGVQKGDVIAHGKVGVACTEVDATTSEDYDVVTVKLGIAIDADTVLYQAKAASANTAEPLATPDYILGTAYDANTGDQEVRLINGANIRKETANIAPELAALLPMIKLV